MSRSSNKFWPSASSTSIEKFSNGVWRHSVLHSHAGVPCTKGASCPQHYSWESCACKGVEADGSLCSERVKLAKVPEGIAPLCNKHYIDLKSSQGFEMRECTGAEGMKVEGCHRLAFIPHYGSLCGACYRMHKDAVIEWRSQTYNAAPAAAKPRDETRVTRPSIAQSSLPPKDSTQAPSPPPVETHGRFLRALGVGTPPALPLDESKNCTRRTDAESSDLTSTADSRRIGADRMLKAAEVVDDDCATAARGLTRPLDASSTGKIARKAVLPKPIGPKPETWSIEPFAPSGSASIQPSATTSSTTLTSSIWSSDIVLSTTASWNSALAPTQHLPTTLSISSSSPPSPPPSRGLERVSHARFFGGCAEEKRHMTSDAPSHQQQHPHMSHEEQTRLRQAIANIQEASHRVTVYRDDLSDIGLLEEMSLALEHLEAAKTRILAVVKAAATRSLAHSL